MRIAWLCPYLPWPENSGGRIRIARLARALAGADLQLYLRLAEDDPKAEDLGSLAPWTHIHGVRVQWPRFANPLLPRLPFSFPRQLRSMLAEHDARQPFDAVVLEHCYSADGLPSLQRAAIILSEHNVESDYYLRALRSRHPIKGAIEYARWRRFERLVWQRSDAITVVNERDRERIQRVRPDTGVVVPNGIALERYSFIPPAKRRGHALLFTGLLSYEPNVEAAKLLAKRILPRVRRRFPDATLTLAGRDPRPKVEQLASGSVRVTGTVPDVAELFDHHAVYVNPVAFGGGSSLKVLEPLATGLPLVASAFAVRGYGLSAEEHYLRADSVDEMARAVCRVFEQRDTLDAMAERSRSIAERYAWSELGPRFAEVIERAIASRSKRPGKSVPIT